MNQQKIIVMIWRKEVWYYLRLLYNEISIYESIRL